MKIIGFDKCRVSMLVDLLEIGTRDGLYFPGAATLLQSKFNFISIPQPASQANPKEVLCFEHGFFNYEGRDINIRAFEIYPHGLVAQAADSNAAEIFLDEFSAFATAELGQVAEGLIGRKFFASSLMVQFDKEANGFLSANEKIIALFSNHLKATYGLEQKAELSRISMRPDPDKLNARVGSLLTEFTLERRINAPYEDQKFYSTAPLRTDDHIAFLQKIEKLALN